VFDAKELLSDINMVGAPSAEVNGPPTSHSTVRLFSVFAAVLQQFVDTFDLFLRQLIELG